MKRCPNCKEIKSENDFYKNKARHDGLDTYCRSCSLKKKKSRRIENICEICGKKVFSYRLRKNCDECYSKRLKVKISIKKMIENRIVIKRCKHRKKEFEVIVGVKKHTFYRSLGKNLKPFRQDYCSLKCLTNSESIREAKSLRFMGEKSHFWKGNKTKLQILLRESFKYDDWRKKIFERDKFTCQYCGYRGKKLNVHHIIPFSFLLDFFKIKSVEEGLKCEALWNINNGITLCIECHKKTDSWGVNQFKPKTIIFDEQTQKRLGYMILKNEEPETAKRLWGNCY